MENNVFPIPFYFHIVFVVIAVLVLMVQFIKFKRKYQIFMSAAIIVSLLLYINTGRAWHNCVGIIELVLFICAIVSSIMDRQGKKSLETNTADTEAVSEADKESDEKTTE